MIAYLLQPIQLYKSSVIDNLSDFHSWIMAAACNKNLGSDQSALYTTNDSLYVYEKKSICPINIVRS